MIDSIHWRMAPRLPWRLGFVFAVGAEELRGERGDDLFELGPAKPLSPMMSSTLEGAVVAHPVEQRCGDLAFGLVGRGEAEAERHPVGRADQIEPEPPEEAGVRGAVAVGGMAGQVGALDRLARLAARNRGRVEQPQPIAERRRDAGEQVDEQTDLRGERPHPLVVAGLLGDVGEQVTKPRAGEAQEAPLGRAVKKDLGDRERDELSIIDPRATACARNASAGDRQQAHKVR